MLMVRHQCLSGFQGSLGLMQLLIMTVSAACRTVTTRWPMYYLHELVPLRLVDVGTGYQSLISTLY